MKTFKFYFFTFLLCCFALSATAKNQTETFAVGNQTFLLNGKPFVIKAAEIHYPRIPQPYWEHRIKMCKALGMNTLCLYVFWNIHERDEGLFNFTDNNDLAAFVRLAQKNGMYVIVRPGPYVCAEWEMGGLPWWLLMKKKDIRLREQDPYFMERVKIFEEKVAEQLRPLTIENGGPIIMIQVENEYGSYGEDKAYVSAIRDILRANYGDKITLFQCDWSSNFEKNGLDDLVWTMNFGTGANIDNEFKRLGQLRPESPRMCSEFWSGWFDKWGGKHETRNAKAMVEGIKEMLDRNISFSLYMTHGGTSFGHWAGANSPGFAPDVTSYDYDAPINEYGQATEKYWQLRSLLQQYSDKKLPNVPKSPMPFISVPQFEVKEYASLFDFTDDDMFASEYPKTMEEYRQGWGSMIYKTKIPARDKPAKLHIENAHDFTQVYVGPKLIGTLDRRMSEKDIVLPSGEATTLTLVVEAMGRINFGRAIKDYKGIVGDVELTMEIGGNDFTAKLKNWRTYPVPDFYVFYMTRRFEEQNVSRLGGNTSQKPGYFRTTFNINKVGDTFLDMSTWGKGFVYINGHNLGRFWNIGPQQTLYCPGCWLKKGENEIIIFDIVGPKETLVQGLKEPIIDKLQLAKPVTHRLPGEKLDLTAEIPVHKGQFAAGNGWQEVKLGTPVTGRYVCIHALNSHNNREYACIAEWYLLDADGKRISREPWQVNYADDEDITTGNKTADKIFDLQESTYWSTNRGVAFPHDIIIDLGKDYTLSGFQYLPRVEAGAPESIRDYEIYVKETEFKK